MNNEPVAYRHLHEDGWEYYDAPTGEDCKDCIPLYTHPAKTLTDEDYMILGLRFMQWNREQKEPLVKLAYEQYVFEQAIAILRKAQEK